MGKPWRYARLIAPYDFPILRSDSAVMQIEDSIRNQIVPRYTFDTKVSEDALRQLQKTGGKLPAEASTHLQQMLEQIYHQGVITGEEKSRLAQIQSADVILVDDLFEDLNACTVSNNAHDTALGDFAHGRDLGGHAAGSEP